MLCRSRMLRADGEGHLDTVDVQVLRAADEWIRNLEPGVLGTVIRTWGSAPRPPGSLIAVSQRGQVVGSVSGGCIEDDLVERVRSGRLALVRPHRLVYGANAAEAERFQLPCGGSVELILEPLTERSKIGPLLARLALGQTTRRTLDLGSGEVGLDDASGSDRVICDGDRVASLHGPRWRLLIIGAGQLAQYVGELAVACDYEVLVCDPRPEYADTWSVPGTALLRTMPDDTVLAVAPDSRTAVVALTHDPKLDDLALIEALKSPAFYVGALGSRRNQAQRKERLTEFGIGPAEIARLHGPVGVKNGARTAPEMAASIVADLTAAKYGFRIPAPEPIV
jgi:xanthine dehydrogenase accessory factor